MSSPDQFLASMALSETEARELAEVPHSQLLERAFSELAAELDTNGNTDRFHELRAAHAHLLIGYWLEKRAQYEAARAEGRAESEYSNRERLIVTATEDYHDEDDKILHIERLTTIEKDDVSITVNTYRGLDEFMHPPRIKSEIRTDPEEAPDIFFEVVFRGGRISTIQRTKYVEDPNHNRSAVITSRTIDCSHFGIDLDFFPDSSSAPLVEEENNT